MNKKNLIIIGVVVLIIISSCLVSYSFFSKDTGNSGDKWRTEKQPITDRFPKFGAFEACYWKASAIGKTDFGPTSYWMKGFVALNKNDFERLKQEYQWKAVKANWKPELDTSILKLKTFSWHKSESFNTQASSLIGNYYLDYANGVIYFDVKK